MANLVSNEFFNEGDLEKEKFKREPIVSSFKICLIYFNFILKNYAWTCLMLIKDSMNRDKSDQMPKMQIQFLQSVCWPLYNVRIQAIHWNDSN